MLSVRETDRANHMNEVVSNSLLASKMKYVDNDPF
jgi:hypothetical protein